MREQTTIIRSGKEGNPRNRLLIVTPTLANWRAEWALARFGQAIPPNWSSASAHLGIGFTVPMHYLVADAQNLGCEDCIKKNFEWCFLGDTLVETSGGAKCIREIEVGDTVKTHTGAFKRVLKTMRRKVKQRDPLIWVQTRHNTIKCTPDHPFFVQRDGKKDFVRAKDLRLTDVLLYPCNKAKDVLRLDITCSVRGTGYNNNLGSKKYGNHIGNMDIDTKMARFFGLFLAEGHCNRDGIAFTFNNDETEYIEFVRMIHRERFGRSSTICGSWATQIRMAMKSLALRFKEWFGPKAPQKKIPSFVYDWTLPNKLAFLKGYMDGDGSYKQNFCSFSSASRELVEGIVRLGNGCGLSFSDIYCYDQRSVGGYASRPGAKIHLCNLNTQSLGKMLDLLEASQRDAYLQVAIRAVEEHCVSANLVDSHVYNLEVEEDNSYIANGASVHNCLFWEDDVVAPPDAFLRLNRYISKADIPVVSGLYYQKSTFTEPLVYRGLGTGAFSDFKIGDKVWADGVPTGFLLIHSKIIKLMWEESEEYETLGKRRTRRIFETPAKIYYDPNNGTYSSGMGTSDLNWCHRVIKEKVLSRAGWPKIARRKYPFLVDTAIFCRHIDLSTGKQYP